MSTASGQNPGDALAQITEIRSQIARNEIFCGYRSATVGFSGLLALAGAAAQARWMVQPREDLTAYLAVGAFAAAPPPLGRAPGSFPCNRRKSTSRRFSKNSGQTSCPLPLTTTNSIAPPRAR